MENENLDLKELKEWYKKNTHDAPLVVRLTLLDKIRRLSEEEVERRVNIRKDSVEYHLIQWCVEYVYCQCVDDNGLLDMVCELTDLSELELMNGFEGISQDMGFDLDRKVDGKWLTDPRQD